jgi:hypothetical protein
MDDRVIDIRRYLEEPVEDGGAGAFSVWGGGGERSRLALPVWRAIYLAGGDWGGVLSRDQELSEAELEPFFVLDLREDPARIRIPPASTQELSCAEAPAMAHTEEGGVAVFLGLGKEKAWFLVVQGEEARFLPEGQPRETLLFLAGECAGLLFFRDLATLSPSSSSAP